jgi:methylmalonyl-CoA mutase C-terminal domain/subunit
MGRIVIAKPGLDGHDRGAKIIARGLRDAGFEVIYTGLHQTPAQIAATVVAEDADVVGISVLSGAHLTLVPEIIQLLKDAVLKLTQAGVQSVFTPGTPISTIVEWLSGFISKKALA